MNYEPKLETEIFSVLEELIKDELRTQQELYQIGVEISTLQRRLLSLQRKRILSETPEEKEIRLLVIKTGLPEDEIRKGLEPIGKD